MTKKIIIWVIVLGIIALVIGYPITVYNYCKTTEVDVLATFNNSKNNMSAAMSQVKGADKVLTREEKKLIEVMNIAVSRYDNAGDAFAFMIDEQNLQVSPESYQQVRQTIEVYYAKFYAGQTGLIDMARAYERKRSTLLFGGIASLFGFPSQKYLDARVDQIVLENGVNKTYDSKDRTMPEIPIGEGK
jgi:hypothetical protein